MVHQQVVCRDIWALHLSLIPEPPPAEPYLHMQERRGEPSEEVLSDDDDDLGALLRLNSESDNDGTSNDELAPTGLSIKGKKKGRRKRGRGGAYDGPASLIAVLVVGCWTMRLGKLYTDFVRCGLRDGLGVEKTNGWGLGPSMRTSCPTWSR